MEVTWGCCTLVISIKHSSQKDQSFHKEANLPWNDHTTQSPCHYIIQKEFSSRWPALYQNESKIDNDKGIVHFQDRDHPHTWWDHDDHQGGHGGNPSGSPSGYLCHLHHPPALPSQQHFPPPLKLLILIINIIFKIGWSSLTFSSILSKSYSRLITIKTMADLIISTIQQPFLLTSTELLHQIMITERMDCQESVLLDDMRQWLRNEFFRMSNEVREKGQIKRLFKRFELQHNIQRNPFVIWMALAMLGNDKKAWLAVF